MATATTTVAATANRDNYKHMQGQALRDYAHKIGAVSRSEATRLSDDKIKEQCRYAIGRQYEENQT